MCGTTSLLLSIKKLPTNLTREMWPHSLLAAQDDETKLGKRHNYGFG